MRPISSTTAKTSSSSSSAAPTSLTGAQHSTWHSPVPYLFGGLAAMLGLIAFALLILACSYWKLSGQPLDEEESANNNMERKEEGESASKERVKPYEEKILVIMAGDEKPTFLATPASAKSSSFADGVGNHSDKDILSRETLEKTAEKETDSHVQATTLTPQPQEAQQQSQEQ